MEHINQLHAWDKQAKAARPDDYADLDVAKRLIKHSIEATEEIARLNRALFIKDAEIRQLVEDVSAKDLSLTITEQQLSDARACRDRIADEAESIRAKLADNQAPAPLTYPCGSLGEEIAP